MCIYVDGLLLDVLSTKTVGRGFQGLLEGIQNLLRGICVVVLENVLLRRTKSALQTCVAY